MAQDINLVGKTIKDIEITGFGVYITFTDGTQLEYDASDGGYSRWATFHITEEVI